MSVYVLLRTWRFAGSASGDSGLPSAGRSAAVGGLPVSAPPPDAETVEAPPPGGSAGTKQKVRGQRSETSSYNSVHPVATATTSESAKAPPTTSSRLFLL